MQSSPLRASTVPPNSQNRTSTDGYHLPEFGTANKAAIASDNTLPIGKDWKTSFVDNQIDLKIQAVLQTVSEDARKVFITKNRVDKSTNQIDDNSP